MAQLMDLQAELRRLQEENARLKANKGNTQSIKVSQKGAVSVYGMGRFPITLYAGTWLKLLDEKAQDIRDFIEDNKDSLKWKDNGNGEDE